MTASAQPSLSTTTPPLRAKVLFDYQATGPQSMSLVKGQIIEVRTRGDRGGWSIGLHGAFPTDFVEFLPAVAATASNHADPFMGLNFDPTPVVASQTSSSQSNVGSTAPVASSSTPNSTFIPPPPPKKASNPPANSAATNTAAVGSSSNSASAMSGASSAGTQSAIPPPPAKLSASTPATTTVATPQPTNTTPLVTPVAVAAHTPSATPTTTPTNKAASQQTTVAKTEPQGFQKIEKHRKDSTGEMKEMLNPLDGTSFVLTPGNLSSPNAVWRQYLFMDLFADCHVRQMADPRNHVRSSTATSRVIIALNTYQKALQYLDLDTYPTTMNMELVRDVYETLTNTLKVSLDLCSRIPTRTNEPSKMFTFLATLMMRIAKMSIGDYLMFPISWQNDSTYKSESEIAEHAIIFILRRINRETTSDFSVTIVNTSVDEGLCFHAMKGNESDASILYNISFTIPEVETSRVSSSTFW